MLKNNTGPSDAAVDALIQEWPLLAIIRNPIPANSHARQEQLNTVLRSRAVYESDRRLVLLLFVVVLFV